jgi:hypothetical protein
MAVTTGSKRLRLTQPSSTSAFINYSKNRHTSDGGKSSMDNGPANVLIYKINIFRKLAIRTPSIPAPRG